MGKLSSRSTSAKVVAVVSLVLALGLAGSPASADELREGDLKKGVYEGRSDEGLRMDFVVEGSRNFRYINTPIIQTEACGEWVFESSTAGIDRRLRWSIVDGFGYITGRFVGRGTVKGKLFVDCDEGAAFRPIPYRATRQSP